MRPAAALLALLLLAACDGGRAADEDAAGPSRKSPASENVAPAESSERAGDPVERAQRRFDDMKSMESEEEQIDAVNQTLREHRALADGEPLPDEGDAADDPGGSEDP